MSKRDIAPEHLKMRVNDTGAAGREIIAIEGQKQYCRVSMSKAPDELPENVKSLLDGLR